VVGCGGTGCSCSAFLARAGIGTVRIADPDVVSFTDLHRQVLYDEDDAGKGTPKVEAAARHLRAANSGVKIEALRRGFDSSSAAGLIEGVDLLIDCSDNFDARMLINEICLEHSLPWVHGACVGSAGIVIPFPGAEAACYRCIVDHVPAPGSVPTNEEAGILGPVAGITGSLEAAEAVKMLLRPEAVIQRILHFDVWSHLYESIEVTRKPDCPACVGWTIGHPGGGEDGRAAH
jgi:adenylyltransferase/sulfurtransferase